jgi:hypothetical protein
MVRVDLFACSSRNRSATGTKPVTDDMHELRNFIVNIFYLMRFVRIVFLALLVIVFIGSGVFSWVEGVPFGASLYASAITALTIGYGDITPKTAAGRVVSIVIGFVGVIYTGLIVAVATRALARAAEDEKEFLAAKQQRSARTPKEK